jgi:hypothetical protein
MGLVERHPHESTATLYLPDGNEERSRENSFMPFVTTTFFSMTVVPVVLEITIWAFPAAPISNRSVIIALVGLGEGRSREKSPGIMIFVGGSSQRSTVTLPSDIVDICRSNGSRRML